MEFIKLETQKQFDELKKGDLVIVDWGGHINSLKAYKIHGVIPGNELLLNKKKNHYFIIDLYLRGESYAKIAYLVKREAAKKQPSIR